MKHPICTARLDFNDYDDYDDLERTENRISNFVDIESAALKNPLSQQWIS